MANLNTAHEAKNTYDVIVVGAGMAGGWAAKEMTQKGYRTLLLERGRNVRHIVDYPTANLHPWELPHRGRIPQELREANPVVTKCYAFGESTQHFFVKDQEHPYIQDKPFDWIRAYQVGGRSLLWARQTQRWSPYDFEGPARDGFAVDWPIRYNDLAPWYSKVERFVGISGNKDGLASLPDGEFLPPMELTCVEKSFQTSIKQHYKDRHLIIGRCAHLTKPQPQHLAQGRGQCMHRNLCHRGCPFGGYFSSASSLVPVAQKTGRLKLRANSVVHSIIYDEKRKRAKGVRVVDAETKTMTEYYARVIFVCGGTINSNIVLLNSTSNRFPNGLGNDHGLLGKYMAFHTYRGGASAEVDGFLDKYVTGRRPNNGYIPRFRNLEKQETDFLRGYAMSVYSGRQGQNAGEEGFGADWKHQMAEPGPWTISMGCMGEALPKESNTVILDKDLKDPWGVPQARLSFSYDDNDEKMIKDFFEQASEMLDKGGFKNIKTWDSQQAPGLDIHEMGGIRMGRDPKTSLLNKWNQLHACKNVFVTDGACMTSVSTQNPSLTFMAITARAANYAADALRKGLL